MDVTALGEEIDENLPKTFKGHKGIIKSARNLAERLNADNMLRNAFSGEVSTYILNKYI